MDNQQQRLLLEENVQRLKVWNLMYKFIVYKTTNKINGYIYIGVHGTDTDIDDGYIGNSLYKTSKTFKKYKFHNAVKKYGGQNFVRETLFEYPYTEQGKKAAFKKEAELVNRDFLKRKDVYNTCLGGKVPSSVHEKPIAQYEINGKFIRMWYSASEVERELGFSNSGISTCCVKKSYCCGFQWRYYTGDESDIEEIQTKEKVVYQFDLQGNYLNYYKSVKLAEIATGISSTLISRVCLDQQCQAGGYYWNYKKRFDFREKKKKVTAVACYDDSGKFIKSYTSLIEAAKENNVGAPSIHKAISGQRKHCNKLRWRYFYGNTSNINPL